MYTRRLALLLWCGVAIPLLAQPVQHRFISFPQDNALSHSSVTAMLQDHKGFLWVGTWWGLMRFDGYSLVHYRQEPGRVNGLESNKINCLFEDSRKRLWVGTQNSGIYLYDRASDAFIHYRKETSNMNSLSDNRVWTIYEDHLGFFWIGTESGLNYFDPENGTFIHFTHNPPDHRSLSYDFVYTVCETPDRTLWIGTEYGLNRLVRKATGEPDYFIRYSLAGRHDEVQVKTHEYIYKIRPVVREPAALWVGTKAGLKKVRFSTADVRLLDITTYSHDPADPRSISHNYVVDVLPLPDGGVWLATYSGLNLMEPEGVFSSFYADESKHHALTNNQIRSLYCDQSMNLWIGTEGGLHKLDLDAKPFMHILPDRLTATSSQVITSILECEGRPGVWLGSRGGGLHFANALEGSLQQPVPVPLRVKYSPESAGFISDVCRDPYGYIWISTLGAGALRVHESELIRRRDVIRPEQYSMGLGLDNLSSEHIMTVAAMAGGDVWFGGWDFGLVRYDQEQKTFTRFEITSDFKANLLAYPVVHLLETDESGQHYIWAGTRGGGLLQLKYDSRTGQLLLENQFTADFSCEGTLSNNYINCLFRDPAGRMWIGTENGLNVHQPETGTFRFISEKDGLPNGNIQAILTDKEHRLWVSTQKGLSCLAFTAHAAPEIKNYDVSDGLQANYFNDDAMCRTRDGMLIFGGINGLTVFDPSYIGEDKNAPRIAISGFRLSNEPVSIGQRSGKHVVLTENILETKKIELAHRDNVISFEFVGIHFSYPDKVVYARKLEGFDPDWVYTNAAERIAHYTNLPFGKYTFRVKASNGDGYWSDEAGVEVIIHRPFWATVWAYIFYAIAALCLHLTIRRIVLMRAEFRQRLEIEKLEREKLEEINQLKVRFFTNISHELRTPLTLIISPLQQLIRENHVEKKLVNTYRQMHLNATRLLNMINQLLDIRRSDAGLMKLHVQETHLVPYIKEIIHSFRGMAKQRQIRLKFFHTADACYAWIDQDQMEKVLFNLLSNAFKYTPENGMISITLEAPGEATGTDSMKDGITLRVRDSGIGIPPDHLPFVFDRFYRVEQQQGRSPYGGGTGIGLSLAKSIIEAHGGTIAVESQPGQGAVFTLTWPAGHSHFTEEEKCPPAIVAEGDAGGPAVHAESGLHTTDQSIEPIAVAPEPGPDKRRATVLLVEDNDEIRAYLKDNLAHDFYIIEAVDGKEGLEKAIKKAPDLIVADIAMPVMDGLEMCREIRSDVQTSHIPVILLTARTAMEFKLEGFDTGADEYITKPFNMQLLQSRIHNLIDNRVALREKFARSLDLSPTGISVSQVDEEFLNRIKAIVEENMDNSAFNVEDLAAGLYMSRMQLYRKLKTLVGQSPNQVIRTIRLKRAVQLLQTRRYTIADVTYMVGYNDLKSFRDQFRKEFGVSPSAYDVSREI